MSAIETLAAEGEALLAREAALCREGRIGEAAALAEEKARLVDRLAAETGPPGPAERRVLERLVAAARANERLLDAARRGVATARRRLAEAGALRAGAVAYRADGGVILSREDAARRTRRA
jgi:hypothetical protein